MRRFSSLKLSTALFTTLTTLAFYPLAQAADAAPTEATPNAAASKKAAAASDDAAGSTSGSTTASESVISSGTPTSTMSMPDSLRNKKFEDNTEITDAKLKADSGSLSRYSVKFSANYYGPTVDDMSKKSQPNPDGGIGVYDTSLSGSISTRYRIDSKSTVGFGTGLNALTPLHGIQRVDVNNPYISYDMTDRLGPFQMRNSPGVSAVTVPNYTKVGEFGSINWDSSLVYKLGATRFSTGIDGSVGYYLYSRPYEPDMGKVKHDGKAQRSNIAIYPTLKYSFTDNLILNTSLNISYWNPRSEDSQLVLWNKTTTQRLGLGWAIKRDIYLFPYVNFFPTNFAIDTTTINFSTVFSLL